MRRVNYRLKRRRTATSVTIADFSQRSMGTRPPSVAATSAPGGATLYCAGVDAGLLDEPGG